MTQWPKQITVELLSDTTFGRGDGVAGLVDQEVEHDLATGLPFIRGRTLKGLLVEACADILFSLKTDPRAPGYAAFEAAAKRLFGQGGSLIEDAGKLRVGNAEFPDEVKKHVLQVGYSPATILDALTTIRYQTAIDETTGAPAEGSLRASRAVIRGRVFTADIDIDLPENDDYAYALLVACVRQVRRGGSGRGRGRGRLAMSLPNVDERIRLDNFRDLAERGLS
jgi:hypothetical protein